MPAFVWDDLRGSTVIDLARIGTATFTFTALLQERGLADAVTLVPASLPEDEARSQPLRAGGRFRDPASACRRPGA